MNSNRVSPKRVEKKKRTKTQNTDVDSKRKHGSKHILYVSGSQPNKKKKKKKRKTKGVIIKGSFHHFFFYS